MSETVALRRLPPVDPIDPPDRYSQTLLRNFSRCQRSAYLYRKYRGGPPSHALDRGTAFHRFAEQAVRVLMEQGENRLPPEVAKDLMAEVVTGSEDLTVPPGEQETLRIMAYHFAEGVVIDPGSVVALEQPFVLEVEEFQVVGKPDVVFRDGDMLTVWDYKSGYAMAARDEIGQMLSDGRATPKTFQLLLYVLLVAQGRPLYDEPSTSSRAPTLGDPIGDGIQLFRGFEKYPMYLYDDGIGSRGPLDVERPELVDHRIMLEGLVFKLARSFESWEFEAVPGSHCVECPARSECPLPAHLRNHQGTINSVEEAAEASEWLYLQELDQKALKAELKNFASFAGPIRYGTDRVRDFSTVERRETDKDGLLDAAMRAAEFGEPFRPDDFVRVSTSTRFADRKLKPDELEDEDEAA